MANWLSVNGYNEFATAKRCNQLSTVWEEETPHARFWKNLVNYNIGTTLINSS